MASNIEQNLNKILSNRYGKDVRQAIHDGIKQCYDDVTNPDLNTEAFETAVQNKIDSGELAAMTIPDGSITKEKLDQDITENIETNTNGIADLKSAFNGVQFTDQDIVTYLDSTSFLIGQLFDIGDCTLGYVIDTENGNLVMQGSNTSTGSGTSPLIYAIPGRKVKIATSMRIAFWTKDKEFISGYVGTGEDTIVPENARYFQVSVLSRADVMCSDIVSGRDDFKQYESYMDAYMKEVYQYDDKIRAKMIPSEQRKLDTVVHDAETNKLDIKNIDNMVESDFDIIRYPIDSYSYPLNPRIAESGWTDGIRISTDDGTEIEDANYSTSGYIHIPRGLKFRRGRYMRIAFYDKRKRFIKMDYDNSSTAYGVFVVAPDDAWYVRFMLTSQDYKDGFESSTNTHTIGNNSEIEWTSYKNMIPTLKINADQIEKTNNPIVGLVQKNTQIMDWDDDSFWQKKTKFGCIIPYTEKDAFAPNPFVGNNGILRIYILDSDYNVIGYPQVLQTSTMPSVLSFKNGVMTYRIYANAEQYKLYENVPMGEYSTNFKNTEGITPAYIWFLYYTLPTNTDKCGITRNYVSDDYVPYGADIEVESTEIGLAKQINEKFNIDAKNAASPDKDTDIIRLINGNSVRRANEMRNAIRVATLNMTVASRSANWKRASEALENEGVDICGYNEVGMPNGEILGDYNGKIFKDYMSTWALPYHSTSEDAPEKTDDGSLYSTNAVGSRWKIESEEYFGTVSSCKHVIVNIRHIKKQITSSVEEIQIPISFYSSHTSATSGADRITTAKEIIEKMNKDDTPIKICVMDSNDNLGEHDVHRLFIKAGYLPAIPYQVVDQIFYDPKYLKVVNYKSYMPNRYTYQTRLGKTSTISDHGLFYADLQIDFDSLIGIYWTDEKITEIQESELNL